MGRLSDPSQKDFFKKRWQQRVWRVKKKFIPVFLSSLFVFGIILTCYHFLYGEFFPHTGRTIIMIHTFLAVLLAVAVVVLGDCWHLWRKSSFLPIQVRVRRRGHHE